MARRYGLIHTIESAHLPRRLFVFATEAERDAQLEHDRAILHGVEFEGVELEGEVAYDEERGTWSDERGELAERTL